MIDPIPMFEELAANLGMRLAAQGFRLADRQVLSEAFGSRFVEYSKGTQEVRLIWDGRERWFLLQQRGLDLHGESPWVDIAFEAVGHNPSSELMIDARATIELALKHLA